MSRWYTLALVSIITWTTAKTLSRRPFELEIHRERSQTASSPCLLLSLRETQQHKKLAHSQQDYILESRRLFHEHVPSQPDLEYVRLYSYSVDVLRSSASSLCGHPSTWSFPALGEAEERLAQLSYSVELEEDQVVLPATVSTKLRVPSPPLQITPLISSGSSSNRVDLVFFSDGCM